MFFECYVKANVGINEVDRMEVPFVLFVGTKKVGVGFSMPDLGITTKGYGAP